MSITPVAVVGRPAPGISGNFDNIYNITINDAGMVTTKASARDPNFTGGFWTGTPASLQLYTRTGAAAPGMPPGTRINNLFLGEQVPILTDGQLAFAADLEGGPYTDTQNNTALWAGPLAAPGLVAYVGSPAHGVPNATYDSVAYHSLASERILYPGQLAGGGITVANRYGLWEGPIDAPELLFRSGQHAPGTPDSVNFGEFWGVKLNSAGQISFGNSLQDPGVPSEDSLSLWAGSRTNPQLVFRSGLLAPGTSPGVKFTQDVEYGPYAELQRSHEENFNEQGQVIFQAFLTGPGVDETNDSGIFAGQPGALQLIARTGSQAPGAAPGVNFTKSIDRFFNQTLHNFEQIKQNNVGTIAFNGKVMGPGITETNDEGLWLGEAGSIELFAREGDQAPGTAPGVVFSRTISATGTTASIPFTGLVLTDTDQIGFLSGLDGPGVNADNNTGLFASNADGIIELIARSGDFLDVGNGELRQIRFLNAESFNNVNQLAFRASFTDGTNAAFVATVPEPANL